MRGRTIALGRLALTEFYEHDVLAYFYHVANWYKHVGLCEFETFTARNVKALDFAFGKIERQIADAPEVFAVRNGYDVHFFQLTEQKFHIKVYAADNAKLSAALNIFSIYFKELLSLLSILTDCCRTPSRA